VDGIRSGEESLRVVHGDRVFYRRIAGSPNLSKENSCEQAVQSAHEDIRKENPETPKLPFVVEVMVYDREHQDCAVTLSVPRSLEGLTIAQETNSEEMSEDDVSLMLQNRSEAAVRFAQVGIRKQEFESFTKDEVIMEASAGECERVFRAPAQSVHGTTHVCWNGEHVVGYCTTKDNRCWKKTP
jgi:hypothetical protein